MHLVAGPFAGVSVKSSFLKPSFFRPDTLAAKVYILIMDSETKQALEGMELRILERIEATETKLLRAFLGWGRTTDAKLRSLPLIDERLGSMEERLTEVERKLLERGL